MGSIWASVRLIAPLGRKSGLKSENSRWKIAIHSSNNKKILLHFFLILSRSSKTQLKQIILLLVWDFFFFFHFVSRNCKEPRTLWEKWRAWQLSSDSDVDKKLHEPGLLLVIPFPSEPHRARQEGKRKQMLGKQQYLLECFSAGNPILQLRKLRLRLSNLPKVIF